MEWRSWLYNDRIQWGLFDGDIELGRIHPFEPLSCWLWNLFDRDNVDDIIEGLEPTAALAAHALMHEMKSPSVPNTLTNVPK